MRRPAAAVALAAAAALVLPGAVSAKPWHSINQLDINGNTCPPLVRFSQACPVLCVSDLTKCPAGATPPACPTGQFYCADGQCRTGASSDAACANVPSLCGCQGGKFANSVSPEQQAATGLLPCMTAAAAKRVNVNVTAGSTIGTDAGDTDLTVACAAAYGISGQITNAATGPFFVQCVRVFKALSSFEPEFMVFYGFVVVQSIILVLYQAYRGIRMSMSRGFAADAAKQTTMFDDGHVELQEVTVRSAKTAPEIKFTGYRRDPLGMLVLGTIVLSSFIWLFLMAIIIADYYEVFSGYSSRNSTLLFGDHENLSRIFIVLWHIMTVWFVALQINSSWLQTYFSVRAPLASASQVLVEKEIATAVQFQNQGKMIEQVQRIEAVLRRLTKTDRSLKLTTVKHTHSGRHYIEFECVRYVFEPTTGSFEPFHFPIGPTNAALLNQAGGLSSSEAERRIELAGANEIIFRVDTFARGIIKEFTGMFYIYQLMTLLIWMYYSYYYMALVLTAVIVGSGITKVVVSTNAQRRVLEMATFHGSANVLRDGTWSRVDCSELVPGDVIEIEASENELSVDCVLVKGEIVADESSLTGEALPVAKFSVKKDEQVFNRDEAGKINSLFAGCHVLETRPDAVHEPVVAIVLATGASTAKGRLVRDILYPMPVSFVFMEHLKVVLPLLAFWGVVMLFLSMAMLGASSSDAWFYGMFTISQVLSPLLPAVLVIGQSISADRLRKQGIMCVDLSRITLAGKVKVFCFDKTGTLTKEGLDFLGTHAITESTHQFARVETSFASFSPVLKQAMHCCHSLSLVGEQFVGNFVDIEMFRATGARLDTRSGPYTTVTPSDQAHVDGLRILKRFEFVHSHAYMSVVAQEVTSGKITVFLKGSFEKLRDLTNPFSLPSDFERVAKGHSGNGCYVLAIAKRDLPAGTTAEEVLSWPREQVERGADMAGLMLFRNELKPDTEAALNELREGGCRVVMITGDHASTGVHIARASGMLRRDWQGQEPAVYMADVDKAKNVVWTNVDDDSTVDASTLESEIARSRNGFRPVELVVTGKAFNALIRSGFMREYLHETRVFARMSPEDKVKCVRLHMARSVTAMCGDGGNDAGALKAAHAGVALSEAKSSVVSHFSSSNRSVMSCVDLLKEARCSLDISFASYKYLIMYGEILAFMGLVQYYFVVNMSQAMWILIDGSTVPVSWALTMARPSKRLVDSRPTARLLGPETIVSVVGQIVINIVFSVVAVVLLFGQSFFRCREFDGTRADMRRWWELADNYEAEVTGLLGTFQILHAAAAFNLGSKYRNGFLMNRTFLVVYGVVFALITFITLAEPNALGCLFHVNCGTADALSSIGYSTSFPLPTEYFAPGGHNVMPMSFRLVVWGLSVLNLLALLGWEGLVVLGPVRQLAKSKWPRRADAMRV